MLSRARAVVIPALIAACAAVAPASAQSNTSRDLAKQWEVLEKQRDAQRAAMEKALRDLRASAVNQRNPARLRALDSLRTALLLAFDRALEQPGKTITASPPSSIDAGAKVSSDSATRQAARAALEQRAESMKQALSSSQEQTANARQLSADQRAVLADVLRLLKEVTETQRKTLETIMRP